MNKYLLLMSDPWDAFNVTLLSPHIAILRLFESPTQALDGHVCMPDRLQREIILDT